MFQMIGLLPTLCWAGDYSRTNVVIPAGLSAREEKAVSLLIEEVHQRTGLRWPIARSQTPANASAVINITPRRLLPSNSALPPIVGKEGFTLQSKEDPIPTVTIIGDDERGLLFGIGYLLRKWEMLPGKVVLTQSIDIRTKPAQAIRGHQLGYRPKTNSYDAWDLPQWDAYIRDLAVFGSNAIELIPPKSDDDDMSPHFPRPKMEMMVGMSKLADDYGLDVWIWYPAIDGDYADPAVVEKSLQEWGEVLSKLPRVDAVFVPTGDPGNTRPNILMPMLEKQAAQLKRIHPKATIWISVQGLIKPWFDEMMALLAAEPKWLTGVCYGPQTRVLLPEFRRMLPARYPIRRYPDITHCIWCQYPVTDWDLAFAQTEGREPINPRPMDQTIIYRAFDDDAIGFITYSEGCNDDVNKFIWSGLGWNEQTLPEETLRDYARYFIGPTFADSFAQGLLMLEKNWRGPIAQNDGITKTLAHFQMMESQANDRMRSNWRFQQALYRAYYDAFVRERLLQEQRQEDSARYLLKQAQTLGSISAMDQAEALLQGESLEATRTLRQRVFQLADDLFKSIRMQLSVPRYQAIALWRGANLDSIDVPLNNAPGLRMRFKKIRAMEQESDRLAAIREILWLTGAEPGSYYDDLGNPLAQPHLVSQPNFEKDPASLKSPYVGFEPEPGQWRSWGTYADGLFDVPVVMRYEGLDAKARYKVRVVYASESRNRPIRLVADESEVHPLMDRPMPPRPIEFSIPIEATKDGELVLRWTSDPERGGNGRGAQVADVWLIKED
ncbi:hypothetical protein K2X85_19725 [bacterium]|nr:hypothetical protein [bacterium]